MKVLKSFFFCFLSLTLTHQPTSAAEANAQSSSNSLGLIQGTPYVLKNVFFIGSSSATNTATGERHSSIHFGDAPTPTASKVQYQLTLKEGSDPNDETKFSGIAGKGTGKKYTVVLSCSAAYAIRPNLGLIGSLTTIMMSFFGNVGNDNSLENASQCDIVRIVALSTDGGL